MTAKTDEPIETVTQFCVCSEEYCFCTETMEMPLGIAAYGGTWQCIYCMKGDHVWSPGEKRITGVVSIGDDDRSDGPWDRFTRWVASLLARLR